MDKNPRNIEKIFLEIDHMLHVFKLFSKADGSFSYFTLVSLFSESVDLFISHTADQINFLILVEIISNSDFVVYYSFSCTLFSSKLLVSQTHWFLIGYSAYKYR